ncbi:unnamed protein product [Toxocara canis]|uniref:Keratin, type II cytoskeletal 1 n=1 Tax=Toxocara canis TaxID=6265 RepID=A0A183VDK7_TOXCA|nr:unnamed protein product [Toxocara canis]
MMTDYGRDAMGGGMGDYGGHSGGYGGGAGMGAGGYGGGQYGSSSYGGGSYGGAPGGYGGGGYNAGGYGGGYGGMNMQMQSPLDAEIQVVVREIHNEMQLMEQGGEWSDQFKNAKRLLAAEADKLENNIDPEWLEVDIAKPIKVAVFCGSKCSIARNLRKSGSLVEAVLRWVVVLTYD